MLLMTMWQFCFCGHAHAQIRDGFESGSPRLRLWSSDANAQVTSHELTTTLPASGQSSEAIEVNCTNGTFAYLIYPIRPAALIEEFKCSINLRAAPRGLRLGLRVTLPQSIHPASGTPAQLVLFGSANSGRGQWSQLVVEQVLPKFEEQLRILNREVGYSVDSRNAYIDGIVIDAYNGPGATRLQIDDLAVEGLATASITIESEQMLSPMSKAETSLSPDIPTQVVELQRSLPRLIQYRGESLDWLKSLGITGVLLDTEADPLLVKQAERSSMYLIASPPTQVGWDSSSSVTGARTIWNLASAATLSDLDRTREAVVHVSKYPSEMSYPRFVEAMEAHALYSRLAEVVAFPIPMPTTVNSHIQMKRMVGEQLVQSATRAVPLASIVLEPPQAWVEQCQYLRNLMEQQGRYLGTDSGMTPIMPIRQSIAHAIGMGFRGVLFRSTSPLDSGRETDLARANIIQALNAELDLVRPWIESGQSTNEVGSISNALYTCDTIATERSTLMIFNTQGEFDQIAPVSPNGSSLEFIIPRRNAGEQAYRISFGRLESLPLAPKPEGWGIRMEAPSIIEYVVVTNDQVVLQYLQYKLSEYANQVSAMRITTAANLLLLAQTSLHHEGIAQSDAWWSKLQTAEALLRAASTHDARNNKPESIRNAEHCINLCSEVLRSSWLRATAIYADPRSTPFLSSLASLPLHWQFHQLVRGRPWQSHVVPAAEFHDLQVMQQSGWTQDRRMLDRIEHQFAIVDSAGSTGHRAMFLSARSQTGERIAGGFAGSTMRVASPGVPLFPGRIVRIRSRIRMDVPSEEPLAGLLVYEGYEKDLFGRSTLGRPVLSTTASAGTWQEIDLYRVVSSDSPLKVHFEVRGGVSSTIDQLSIETMTITPTNPNFITTPIGNRSGVLGEGETLNPANLNPAFDANNRVLEPTLNN